MLYELFGDDVFHRQDLPTLRAFTSAELELISQMLLKKVNAPVTTSIGRIFDAIASLIGLQQKVNYEGQAAMELEFLTQNVESDECYPFEIDEAPHVKLVDWRSILGEIITDMKDDINHSIISAKFHNTLVEIIIAVAKMIGQPRVVLSGGCFQNRYLTERAVKRLQEEEFRPYWHQRVPPNDGGIALGQIYAALRLQKANRP
jgi:hydrogenase maturation protein HypF